MAYNFQKFEDIHARYESRITITGSYSIGFPTKFYKDNEIENYKYIILYWDPESRAVGIQLTNDESEPAKLKISKTREYGAMVSAKSFFVKYGINPKDSKGRYDWEKIDQPGVGQVFVIKLK